MTDVRPPRDTDGIVVTDEIDQREQLFPFPKLLSLKYFQKYRFNYYEFKKQGGFSQPIRNYYNLLLYLQEVHEYSNDDAATFAKTFRTSSDDWANGEATFAELIVYRYYIRLTFEGLIKRVRLGRQDCDVIVERLDGTEAFLEVFSICPTFPTEGVYDKLTHTQDHMASVRQKLLRKINTQGQLSKPRDNYAVIELNNSAIAGSFTVLASLSSGYKVNVSVESGKIVGSGYDWSSSVFDDECTRHLKGVIWFDLGDYESRKFLLNPKFASDADSTPTAQ